MSTVARIVGRFAVIAAAVAAAASCSPDVLFLGDPALGAIYANDEAFAREIGAAGQESGQRIVIEWDPSPELSTAWTETQIAERRTPVVALSPYFSLFAVDIAARFPDTRFVAFYGSNMSLANLTVVRFDRVGAFVNLAAMLADWVDEDESRSPAGMFVTGDRTRGDEMRAFLDQYAERSGGALVYREFSSAPDRELVRSTIRELRADGANALVLFLGSSGRYAFEHLRSDLVPVVTDHLPPDPAAEEMILASVYDPLDVGLARVLQLPDSKRWGIVVDVDSVARMGPK